MTASVYLCGFMGCGKSHIGRLLAAELGRELVDLDKVIVDREGMSIPEIFEKFGEPHFRSLEAKYIRELGGGYIGISVYINTPFEVCYERIKNDSNRPLVVNNTQEQLRQLYDTRSAIYRRNSMYMVNGNARDSVICGEIVKLVKCFEANGLN